MNGIWKQLIVAITSSLIAIFGSFYIYKKQIEITKLDLHENFDASYFSKPKFPSDEITLKVNGQDKEKLGVFNVSLINYTTKTFFDTPITIKITPKNPSNFKVLAYSAVGEKEVSDWVTELKKMNFDGSSYNFSYQVSSINRAEGSEYGMQLRILFEGDEHPDVGIVAKGFKTRKFDISNSPNQKWVGFQAILLAIVIIISLVLVTIIIFSPILSHLTKVFDIRTMQKYAREIFETLKANNLQPQMNDIELSEFVADMLFNRQVRWWESKTTIGKWCLGMIPPKREHYLISP